MAQLGAEAKTQSTRPFFHTYVRLVEGESLSRDQWLYVADRIEKQLGFDDQPRALAFHHLPDGATHLHIAWSRVDLEHECAIDPGLYKLKLKEISRQLEKELGLIPVRNERDPDQKTLAPGRNEFEQARRLGTDLKDIREAIRACWERSDSGRSFEAALAEQGLILARGDQRDFVVVDHAGGDHALGKRLTGATAAETRARLADVDKAKLPRVAQAKEIQAERARLMPAAEIAPQMRSAAIVREAPEKGIGEFPAPANNAPAAPAPRPIVADEPKPARNPETGERTSEASSVAPARHHGARDAGDVAGRAAGSFVKAIGKLFEFLADMISPPAAPTPDQQQRAEQAAEERAADRQQAAAASDYSERVQQQQDIRARLEEQLKADLAHQKAREKDHDRDYGRER